jgi:hypothetical protein
MKNIIIAAMLAAPLSPFVLIAIHGVFPMVSANALILGLAALGTVGIGTTCVAGNVLHEL